MIPSLDHPPVVWLLQHMYVHTCDHGLAIINDNVKLTFHLLKSNPRIHTVCYLLQQYNLSNTMHTVIYLFSSTINSSYFPYIHNNSGPRIENLYRIMQIIRGGKVSWLHDLLVIRRKTFAIVQQFETPCNKKEKNC